MRIHTLALASACTLAATAAIAQNFNIDLVGTWDQDPGTYGDVWGEGDLAYVGKFGEPWVLILDVSDPASPQLVSKYTVPPPNQNTSAQDVKTGDGLMFIGLEADGNAGAQIVDIRDPAAPRHLVDISINADTHNVFYADGWLYLADSRTNRFAAIDLRGFDPDNPPSTITTPTWWVNNVGHFVHDITVQGDRLYASAWDGIYVYDVSDIENQPPRLLGSAPGDATHSAWATADQRYLVTAEERSSGGIKLYEVTPDGSGGVYLSLRDSYAVSGETVHNPLVMRGRVYCSWYGLGCMIFNIDRDTGTLVHTGRYDTPSAWGIYPFLGPARILLSDMASGLYVLSICEVDFDGSGALDTQDFLAFLNAWSTRNPAADWDGNGLIDTRDFLEYLSQWVAGC